MSWVLTATLVDKACASMPTFVVKACASMATLVVKLCVVTADIAAEVDAEDVLAAKVV